MSRVGLIILAAGGSRRLGRPKQLLLFRGKPLLRHVAEIAMGTVCQPVAVVLGANVATISPVLTGLPITMVVNPEWESGMNSSIASGLEFLLWQTRESPPLDSLIIMLCDQPLVTIQLINGMVARQTAVGCGIVASEYGNAIGVPALFTQKYFRSLLSLSEHEGARQLIKNNSPDVSTLAFPEGRFDIDTEADYHTLMSGPASSDNLQLVVAPAGKLQQVSRPS